MGTKEQHTRELLRRWISGEINAREEAELLAAAEHDPFLREALAAYRAMPELDHAAALSRLRRATPAAAGPAKVRSLTRWAAVAAGVLVLLTAAWWIMDSPLDQANSAMALEATPATTADAEADIPPPPVLEPAADNEPAAIAQAAPRPSPDAETPPFPAAPRSSVGATATGGTENSVAEPSAPQSANADFSDSYSTFVPNTNTPVKDESAIAMENEPAADKIVTPAPPTSYTLPAREDSVRKREYTSNAGVPVPAAGYRILEGYVRDAEGYPLIGATVREQGTSNGTVTDIDGFFRLSVAEDSEQLVVSYTGYETSEILLEMNDSDLEIAMSESNSMLDEVVVTGYGQGNVAIQDKPAQIARPVDGFRTLKRYIEDNTPVNTPRARVKLRFQVLKDGRLTGFTVINSTNVGQNKLAVDLLTAGPRWEITSGNAPVEVVYVVKFR